ncbi:DUF348 domain-containing protein [bacterium]|nr:DUF348 domain-containing protein [bacterium]MBT4251637.1 DUF348 domain-containing protein [bacterium]MBT4597686.1 DUF348 domain-containing protein [bacterium]MBT6753699.1 DUF348 domain-containing protein [bacterium]MBT7037836.1 DUF348 domain-containing protein [bacterium]
MKRLVWIIVFILIGWLIWNGSVALFNEKRKISFFGEKLITVNDDGLVYQILSDAKNIAEFEKKHKLRSSENDLIYPNKSERLLPGMIVEVWRNRKVKIEVDGKEIEKNTFAKTVEEALADADIFVGRLDVVEPSKLETIDNSKEIVVTRINVENITIAKKVDFETIEKNDKKLQWMKNKIEQAGEKGERVVEYQVTYKNGKEVSRKTLSSEITKKPVTEIVRIGTKINFGKSHTGWGTWYDQGPHPKLRARYPFKGDMFAASPWLPLGSYAKITNKANGKAIIVRINDRGPFGENRIIDLHKPAFTAIASLGAGVLEVKVEEILQ